MLEEIMIRNYRPDDLGDEHLCVGDLEGVGPKALQRGRAELGVSHNDRLLCAPSKVQELALADEKDLSSEWGSAAEGLAHQVGQQGDVGGGDGVPAGAKAVESLPVADKDGLLALAHNELGPDTKIA